MRKAKAQAKPFIKWAGGKGTLTSEIIKRFPKHFRMYHEPFVGGGAVLFALQPPRASIADACPDLINAYKVIQQDVEPLIKVLAEPPFINTKEAFYKIRAWDTAKLDSASKAARFIYLNKTCFNGLWRVNKKGQFNTPFGKYHNPQICDAKGLREASEALQNTTILLSDFSYVDAVAQKHDVVYFDPPYEPVSKTANFTSYTKDGFTQEDQVRLAMVAKTLARKHVKVYVSNSDTPFIREIYKGHRIEAVKAARSINSNPAKRKAVSEVLITL